MSDEKPKKKPVSKSQQLRFRLYDLWSMSGSRSTFEGFYNIWADGELEKIEKRIFNLTHPGV